jgi:hypothetical protein
MVWRGASGYPQPGTTGNICSRRSAAVLLGREGGEMRLKPNQLRCRPTIRWPANTSFDPATGGTATSGKAHRDLTKERRDHMLPVIFHAARVATTGAGGPPGGVFPDLGGDDFLLQPRRQPLRFSPGQPQISPRLSVRLISVMSTACPSASAPIFTNLKIQTTRPTPGPRKTRKCPSWRWHPQLCGSPVASAT